MTIDRAADAVDLATAARLTKSQLEYSKGSCRETDGNGWQSLTTESWTVDSDAQFNIGPT